MRRMLLLGFSVFSFTVASTVFVKADTLPVGTYSLSLLTPTSGIHSGSDEGTLSGTLTFDASSNITAADLIFHDTTIGMDFTFTNPGPTQIDLPPQGFLSASIFNATDPSTFYSFSIRLPSDSAGNFDITCGTDCHTDLQLNEGGNLVEPELNFGPLTPVAPTPAVPEPSTLVLLGSGVLGALGTLRRRRFNA